MKFWLQKMKSKFKSKTILISGNRMSNPNSLNKEV